MSEPAPSGQSTTFSPHEVKLLRGTFDVLARHGAQHVSLRGIARELEVSPALLVYHFGSHQNLITATMRWAFAESGRAVRESTVDVGDPADIRAALFGQLFPGAQATRDHLLMYLELVQYTSRDESFELMAGGWRDDLEAALARMIRAGMGTGQYLVEDIQVASARARAIIEGLMLQWVQRSDWETSYTALRDECERSVGLLLR